MPTRSAAGLLHSTCSCLGAYETGGSSPCVTSADLHQTEIEWHFAVWSALALNFLIHKTLQWFGTRPIKPSGLSKRQWLGGDAVVGCKYQILSFPPLEHYKLLTLSAMEKPKATADNQDWNSSMMSSSKSEKKAADPAAGFYSLKYFRTCLALHLV